MAIAHVLGFPRIGANRELKSALETFWRGDMSERDLEAVGRTLRAQHWRRQREAGLDYVTVGDFAWYDSVLETMAHLGCTPDRYRFDGRTLTLQQYFAMARGNSTQPALELTKWFDTNYHYLVPEWSRSTRFDGGVRWLFDHVAEARAEGYGVDKGAPQIKVVLLGPLTLLYLGKSTSGLSSRLDLLGELVPAYQRLLRRLRECGVPWVQIDEPILTLELPARWVAAFHPTYAALAAQGPDMLLTTYYESVVEHEAMLKSLPVSGLHLDLVRAPEQLGPFMADYPTSKVLSLGVIDGRNIWRANLDVALATLLSVDRQLGDRLWISSSCSLLHVPVDLDHEHAMDPELRSWCAFAVQKLDEIATLRQGLKEHERPVASARRESREAFAARARSARVHRAPVQKRVAGVSELDMRRHTPFENRIQQQRIRLKLPALPTTTIGSFPQTAAIRKARAAFKRGTITPAAYRTAMRTEIANVVARQEALGLDVLVHGEPERNDMVEYFGEQLRGFAVTANGWVQSYGSRCVKPPIIYGDVERLGPMTTEWASFAQSLTSKPVKGMLTGPITLLQWSFVRDDVPRETTAFQIALALRDEVLDLEQAGVAIIQIDEPGLREGLPLKQRDWDRYLSWAVKAFRLASSGVSDDTQIHTHMCYAEFAEILPAIRALDADVITIESSRSRLEALDRTGPGVFGQGNYSHEIGFGVYDVHSAQVPEVADIVRVLERAVRIVPWERLWVNPDCGLKTRGWLETERALVHMVEAASVMRQRVQSSRFVQS